MQGQADRWSMTETNDSDKGYDWTKKEAMKMLEQTNHIHETGMHAWGGLKLAAGDGQSARLILAAKGF